MAPQRTASLLGRATSLRDTAWRWLPAVVGVLVSPFGLVSSVWAGWYPAPAELRPPSPRLVAEDVADALSFGPCVDDPVAFGRRDGPCADQRTIFVDFEALSLDARRGGEWISYDFASVIRPLRAAELADEGELSLAVRLVVSEVGADRLLKNQYGLAEAVGILYTVENRMTDPVQNPENVDRAPDFPGCGPRGGFWACANAEQYLGMATWRALDPGSRYRPELLERAVDVAVLAWYLQRRGFVPDITEGATNYVHRCGGAAYGEPTWRCDGHVGRPRWDDIRGADPHTGPLVFKAPTVYQDRHGFYGLRESMVVDYEPVPVAVSDASE
jgi:hypothetical protein